MRTGVVMEIQDKTAVVLQPNGLFVEQPTRPGWEVGGVVALPPAGGGKAVLFRRLAALAACLVLAVLVGFGGYALFFETASVISVDINPSVELGLNRMGRVVSATAYNDGGGLLLSTLDLKGLPYEEAVPALLQSEALRPYLAENAVLECTVYSQSNQAGLLAYLEEQTAALARQYPRLQAHCSGVGQELVAQAHEHGVTPGRMKALLELQRLEPDIDIDAYSHHSMGELHQLIREHGGQGQGGYGQGSGHGQVQGQGHGQSQNQSRSESESQSRSQSQGEDNGAGSSQADSGSGSQTGGSGSQGGHGHGHGGDGGHGRGNGSSGQGHRGG